MSGYTLKDHRILCSEGDIWEITWSILTSPSSFLPPNYKREKCCYWKIILYIFVEVFCCCFVCLFGFTSFCQGSRGTSKVKCLRSCALTSKKQVIQFLCASERERCLSAHRTLLPNKWDNPVYSTQNSMWHPELNQQLPSSVTACNVTEYCDQAKIV